MMGGGQVLFFVPGTPRPQGNMMAVIRRHKTSGEPYAQVLHKSDAKLQRWRGVVAAVAKHAMGKTPPLAVPLRLGATFVVERPRGHWKKNGELSAAGRASRHVAVRPDLDKYIRALGDALTGVCYRDDSQLVSIREAKIYQPRIDASPGVAVRIDPADQFDLEIALDDYWEALGKSGGVRAAQ